MSKGAGSGANTGTILYNINGTDRHSITATSFGINTITPGSYALNVSGNMFCSGYTYAGGLRLGGFDINTLYNETRGLGFMTLNNISFRTGTSLSDYATRMLINTSGNIGISNNNPLSMLHLGNCEVANSMPVIIFGKNNISGYRNAYVGYNSSFFFVIGDSWNTNGPNTTPQLSILYSAPQSSLGISGTGYVLMQYGYGSTSDERIKTKQKTKLNALDKTLLLRGVEYNDIRIEPEKKKIGLIAQEVELIIPEVVRTDPDTDIKSIEYQNLVGLLVQAIKELNNKVSNLENILIKNNLY